MSQKMPRRDFVKVSASAAFAAPMFVKESVFGANERIVTGHIGLGGMGTANLRKHLGRAGALCDVDSGHLARAAQLVRKAGGKAATCEDYRRLLDRSDIDAVIISTPDHWHALQTIHACEAGKDVYVEKPLTLTIEQGRRMVTAARVNNRIVQTGSMQRSNKLFRRAAEMVRNGMIGELQVVLAGIAKANHPGEPVPDSPVPENLNYNLWLGPAPVRPYNKKRLHYNFRFFWDYSGGQMTNWGAHHIDIAQWGMGEDQSGPIRTAAENVTFHPKGWHEVTETCRVTHHYASGVKLIVGQLQDDIPMGTTFIGTKGRIHVNRGKLWSFPEGLVKQEFSEDAVRLPVSNDHHGDFLSSVKTRELPICDVEIGHRSATVCHLGTIACRLGRVIHWDPKTEAVRDDPEASALVKRVERTGY